MAKTKNSNSQNYLLYFIAILCLGFFIYWGFKNPNKSVQPSPQTATVKQALEFIEKNLVGQKTELKQVNEESGVYKLILKIQNEEAPVYLSKDGKLLFLQSINLEETNKEISSQTSPKVSKCEDVKKENQPVLEAFIVSQCPFGLQMQRILNELRKNIPQLEPYVIVRYIGEIRDNKITSMHGDEEAQENLRQICIREEQKDKYWPYVDCYIQEGKTKECLKSAQIDEHKLNECLNNSQKGIAYAKKDFERQNLFQVSGSPTLIVNSQEVSEFGFGGRTAEALKQILCCAFKEKPSYCNNTLSQEEAATGFSKNYNSSENSASGSCQ